MKIILDTDASKMGKALTAAFNVQRNNPQQKIGTSNGIPYNNEFLVIKNQGSYTVKDL